LSQTSRVRVVPMAHRLLDFIKEHGAEPEPLQVVEVRCFAQVASGIGMEADPAVHALVARSSAKTSSMGIGFTLPEAISSSRRTASSSQAARPPPLRDRRGL
jgi:hypothetical protein